MCILLITLQTPQLIFTLPFIADYLLSAFILSSTSTDTQIEDGSEYVKMTDSEDRNFIDASERLLPRSLRDNNQANYLLTTNWKDNASNTHENSIFKQMTAFALIIGYLVCGGLALVSKTGTAVGTLSLVYGGAGLVQYLGFRTAPVLRALSVNAVSIIGLLLGAGAILSGGLNMTLLLLITLYGIDLAQALDNNSTRDLDNTRSASQRNGPITNFFTISWKANAFNKR